MRRVGSPMSWAASTMLVVASCSEKPAAPPAPSPAVALPTIPGDAGRRGVTTISGFDPRSGMHLDDDAPDPSQPRAASARPGHEIDITLRSTPGGAAVSVDGAPLGPTPQFWQGTSGAEHEFTFTLPGYAMARYRFVPITSGVVHARLEPISEEASDAGVPPPEVVRAPQGGVAQPLPPPSPAPLDAASVTPPVAPTGSNGGSAGRGSNP